MPFPNYPDYVRTTNNVPHERPSKKTRFDGVLNLFVELTLGWIVLIPRYTEQNGMVVVVLGDHKQMGGLLPCSWGCLRRVDIAMLSSLLAAKGRLDHTSRHGEAAIM